jgi:hypothetical protein
MSSTSFDSEKPKEILQAEFEFEYRQLIDAGVITETRDFQSSRKLNFPLGTFIGGTEQGPRSYQQDRAVVVPEANAFFVVDSAGGSLEGGTAASIAATKLVEVARNNSPIKHAHEQASQLIEKLDLGDSAACYAGVRIKERDGKYILYTYQAGDVRIVVVGDGQEIYSTKDQAEGGSPYNALVGPTYASRNDIDNQVATEAIELAPGDKIYIFSDGVAGNLGTKKGSSEEEQNAELRKIVSGKSLEQGFAEIGTLVAQRQWKKDNFTLLAIEFQPTEAAQEMNSSKPEAAELNPEAAIRAATDFQSLYVALRSIGPISGSADSYTPEELIDLIESVRKKTTTPGFITSTFGLRKKVQELMRSRIDIDIS